VSDRERNTHRDTEIDKNRERYTNRDIYTEREIYKIHGERYTQRERDIFIERYIQ